MSLLTYLIFVPTLSALLVAWAPRAQARLIAGLGAVVTFLLSAVMLNGIDASSFSWVQEVPWFPVLGISYHVGVDGPSSLLVVLTTLLGMAAMVTPFKLYAGKEKIYFGALLLLEATLIGAFSALDLVLFYIFFEACLIPVWFLMGAFGGANTGKAMMKFFIYTVVGSLVMLASILWLGIHFKSFDYVLIQSGLQKEPALGTMGLLLFAGFAIAFAVKTPLFPFHSWQPEAYAACPPAGVVLVSGAMAKLGTYGFLRFCLGLFPVAITQQLAPALMALALISIVYGALAAAVQRDVKRLIAYSSISHLGFVVLGLFSGNASAMTGGVFQMINHGITTGGLFLILGIIEEQTGTLKIRSLGGLWETMPVFSRLFLIVTLSAVALPLTNGFIGEFLILAGTFQTYPLAASLATTGVILSAIYMLWMFQRVVYGVAHEERQVTDVVGTQRAVLCFVVLLIFILGLFPNRCLTLINLSLPTAQLARSKS